MEGKDGLRPDLKVDNEYGAFQMHVSGNTKITATAKLYANYSLRNEAPQIEQLLPNTDISNPLNAITGNPDLKPINYHRFNLNYNNYDFQKGGGFYVYINADIAENAVVTKTSVDVNNIGETSYTNVNGKYNVFGGLSFSRKIKLDSLITLSPRIGLWNTYNQNVNFNNEVQYRSQNFSLSPNLNFTLSWKKVFDIRTGYTLNISKNNYENDIFEEQNYLSHSLRIGTTLSVPRNFEWRNDIEFEHNPDIAEGFQKSAWFWNTTLAYSMLKEKGTLTLKVYDLLNQNTNARRYASKNYIQDSQSTMLQQYFMLSFSYKFNTLGSKGETGRGGMYFD